MHPTFTNVLVNLGCEDLTVEEGFMEKQSLCITFSQQMWSGCGDDVKQSKPSISPLNEWDMLSFIFQLDH